MASSTVNLALRNQLFINNEWRNASDGQTFTVFNPSTGQPLMECSNATVDDVAAGVAAARAWYFCTHHLAAYSQYGLV